MDPYNFDHFHDYSILEGQDKSQTDNTPEQEKNESTDLLEESYYDESALEIDLEEDSIDVTLTDHTSGDSKDFRELKEFKEAAPTVPPGWSCEGEKSHMNVKSPSGQHFRSRRHAFVRMVNSGKFSMSQIAEMKTFLSHEGWAESDNIPRGWMIKVRKNKAPAFLGNGGEFFESAASASEFIKKYSKYFSKEDMEKMSTFFANNIDIPKYRAKNTDACWIDDDKLPSGWKTKPDTDSILSPCGQIFRNRRMAIVFMVEKGFNEADIEKMRDGILVNKSWKRISQEGIGRKWLIKARKSSSHVLICDQKGFVFNSKERAIQAFKNQREVTLLECNSFIESINKYSDSHEGFSENTEIVPKGWMYKEVAFGKHQKAYKVLSPEKKHFDGLRKALCFMIQEKYPLADIEDIHL